MEIIQDIIQPGRHNRPGVAITPTRVTIHDTGNTTVGAGAVSHGAYAKGDAAAERPVSWHYSVDDECTVQHLPLDEMGYHAGDTEGNRVSIGIEICENSDGDRAKAEANAADLVAMLLTQLGLPLSAVVPHKYWNNKQCPHIILGRPNGWDGFIAAVAARLPGATPIVGEASATVAQAQAWARARGATDWFVSLAPLYWRLAPSCGGVRPEVAYAQSAKETAFGRFGGTIPGPEYHNPCGLKRTTGGSNDDPLAHGQFGSDEEGVTAHLDHLALYAGAPGYPRAGTPDPRHFPTIAGKALTVEALGGKWAPAADYGQSIVRSYLAGLLATSEPQPPEPAAEVLQLRARVAELEGKVAACGVIIAKQQTALDGVVRLMEEYRAAS